MPAFFSCQCLKASGSFSPLFEKSVVCRLGVCCISFFFFPKYKKYKTDWNHLSLRTGRNVYTAMAASTNLIEYTADMETLCVTFRGHRRDYHQTDDITTSTNPQRAILPHIYLSLPHNIRRYSNKNKTEPKKKVFFFLFLAKYGRGKKTRTLSLMTIDR